MNIAGSISINLHPLVIINISDHATRMKVRNNTYKRSIGALLGYQSGKSIELSNSFELVYDINNDIVTINEEYLKSKLEQFAEVFPTQELLGWYSTGSNIHKNDVIIQKQFMSFNESPVYVILDTVKASISKELPLQVYESEVKIVDNTPEIQFSELSYKIETIEAERIAVDHITHAASTTGVNKPGSLSIAQLSGTEESIKMLQIRINLVLRYLKAVKNGDIPMDYDILRQIKSTCQMLPAIDTNEFKTDLNDEYNDSLLLTYLASITKTINAADSVGKIHNFTYEKQRHKRFPMHMTHGDSDDLPSSFLF